MRCPRKFKYRYIDKLPEEPSQAMVLGSVIHKALETFHRDGEDAALAELDKRTEIGFLDPETYATARQRFYAGVRMTSGLDIVGIEMKFGFDEDFKPSKFDSSWFRGVIDVVSKNPQGLVIYDYKSGWSEPDPRQIFCYALGAVTHKLKVSGAGFVLLATGGMYDYQITENELETAQRVIKNIVSEIENAKEFPRRPGLCGWCAYQEQCEPEGDSFPAKLFKAHLDREKAKEIFAQAKETLKEREEPILLEKGLVYDYEEEVKSSVSKKDKLDAIQWLIDNGHEDYVNVSTKIPEEITANGLITHKRSISVGFKEVKDDGKTSK